MNIVVSMVLPLVVCMLLCQVLGSKLWLRMLRFVLQLPCSVHSVLFRQLHALLDCVLSACFMMRLLYIFRATVTKFYCVLVEYFMELVRVEEVFLYEM